MTDLQASIDNQTLRHLRDLQGGLCASCWQRPASRLARIIPLSHEKVCQFSLEVLLDERNARAVCDSPACSTYWDIGQKTHSESLLVAEIRADLARKATTR